MPAARCQLREGDIEDVLLALTQDAPSRIWMTRCDLDGGDWRTQSSLRSDERSTSPDSVFQIPGFGVPHQRNTQEAHSGPTTRYTLASPRGTMPSCAARGAVPTRVCPCGGTRSPAHLAPYPSSACRGESYLRWSSPVRLEFPILSLNAGRRQRCVPPIVCPTLSRVWKLSCSPCSTWPSRRVGAWLGVTGQVPRPPRGGHATR